VLQSRVRTSCRLYLPMLPVGFTRYPWWRRWFGQRSERAAARYLRKQKFRILARNIEDRLGEIDLLALDGTTVVVVEVRSSESKTFDALALSVDAVKQKKLTDATLRFIQRRKLFNVGFRFDIIAIRWPVEAKKPELRHYRNAFEMVGKYQFWS
jgi:putative endonuclease